MIQGAERLPWDARRSLTTAVTEAVRERLDRVRRGRGVDLTDRLLLIGREALPGEFGKLPGKSISLLVFNVHAHAFSLRSSGPSLATGPYHPPFKPLALHRRVRSDCPLSAMCGRLRVGKSFLHVCSIGRCSHVFGLLVRHMRPLAIMPSADQVPVNSTHSTMRWHKWVVLIAGSTGSALVMVRPFQRAAR